MNHALRVLTLAGVVVGAFACKGGGNAEDTDSAFPKRVQKGEGDATADRNVGQLTAGKALVIDLARPAQPGEATLSPCWTVPAENVAFGRAVCVTDGSKGVELTSAHIEFECGVNETRKATSPLSHDGCDAYEIFAYDFVPALYLRVRE